MSEEDFTSRMVMGSNPGAGKGVLLQNSLYLYDNFIMKFVTM